jgi:hypothetical protein
MKVGRREQVRRLNDVDRTGGRVRGRFDVAAASKDFVTLIAWSTTSKLVNEAGQTGCDFVNATVDTGQRGRVGG